MNTPHHSKSLMALDQVGTGCSTLATVGQSDCVQICACACVCSCGMYVGVHDVCSAPPLCHGRDRVEASASRPTDFDDVPESTSTVIH